MRDSRETDEERAERLYNERTNHTTEDVSHEVQRRSHRRRRQAREESVYDVDPMEFATERGWETGLSHDKLQKQPF